MPCLTLPFRIPHRCPTNGSDTVSSKQSHHPTYRKGSLLRSSRARMNPLPTGSDDRVPGSGVTEPAEGALRAKEDGHRGSWLTLSLRRPNTHQRNHDDQAHYRIDRVG